MLGQVLRHVSETISGGTYQLEEAIQLDRTIRALIALTKVEGYIRQTALCLQTAICYRYLLSLTEYLAWSTDISIVLSWLSMIHDLPQIKQPL